MNSNIEKLIIFPDIHGRKFWKIVSRKYLGRPEFGYIFLGDYLDPYDFEGITEKEALDNFLDMWSTFNAVAKDNVIWLIGNHDYHYFEHLLSKYGCRRSQEYLRNISEFFMKNKDKFKIAYEIYINNVKYLFSHAGVTSGWAKEFGDANVYSAEFLNELYKNNDNHLWEISWERGGNDFNGSCIWADSYELQWSEHPENIYQICGHTLSSPDFDTPIITDKYAMLDARKPFVLDLKTGNISELR